MSLSASTFDPSASTMSRASISASAAAHSLADQLPGVHFGFDELRDRMARFTARFDAFNSEGRKRVYEQREQFKLAMGELEEDQRMRSKDIDIMLLKTTTYQQTMAKEAAEAAEMQTSIAQLSAQRDAHVARREELRAQIASTQRAIDARVAAQQAHARRQAAQARFNIPELDFWTSMLCLTIEGAGREDRLRFVFTHVDERDWDREAWFELRTEKRDYDVGKCRPKLERERIERVLARVNETRELAVLLKGMRDLFVEAMKRGES